MNSEQNLMHNILPKAMATSGTLSSRSYTSISLVRMFFFFVYLTKYQWLPFSNRYHRVNYDSLPTYQPDLPTLFRTLYSMAKFAGLRDPVTFDFEGSSIAYCVDAFSISMGALVGCSPVTAYVESATGISGES